VHGLCALQNNASRVAKFKRLVAADVGIREAAIFAMWAPKKDHGDFPRGDVKRQGESRHLQSRDGVDAVGDAKAGGVAEDGCLPRQEHYQGHRDTDHDSLSYLHRGVNITTAGFRSSSSSQSRCYGGCRLECVFFSIISRLQQGLALLDDVLQAGLVVDSGMLHHVVRQLRRWATTAASGRQE